MDKLFNNLRNGAALQAGHPRKIRPGDGLTAANEIQDHPSVNVPSRLNGGDLRIGKIQAPHLIAHPNYISTRRTATGKVTILFNLVAELYAFSRLCQADSQPD